MRDTTHERRPSQALPLVLAALAALTPVPSAAQTPDAVVMGNGDRLTGEVKGLQYGRLDFKTDATKTIQILWNHVRRVTSPNFFEVVLEGGERRFGALLEPEADGVLRVGLESVYDEVALDDVVSIQRLRQSFWSRLKGRIDVGVSFTKADGRRELNTSAEANYRTRKWRFSASLDGLYRRQESSAGFDREDVTAAAQRFFGGRWLAVGLAAFQRNTELGIERRLISVAGGGYHVVRTVEHDLIAVAGLAGSSERFTDDRDRKESVEAAFGLSYTLFALGGNDFTVEASVTAFPSLSVSRRFRSEFNLDLRKEVVKDLYVSVRGFYTTDNSSESEETGTTDYNVTASLGWSF